MTNKTPNTGSAQICYRPAVTWREVDRLNTSAVKHHHGLELVVVTHVVAGDGVRQDIDGVLSTTEL